MHKLRLLVLLLLCSIMPIPLHAQPSVEQNVQAFLDQQPGPLKQFQENQQSAAQIINGTSAYYGVSPRVLLALAEATNSLLSATDLPAEVLRKPFSPLGPLGFEEQMDWAARELRSGLGPYEKPPTLSFTDGTTITLTLAQAAEGVAVQRFLAPGRTRAEWLAAVERFQAAFVTYFNNELPQLQPRQSDAPNGFLRRPWAMGTRVVHLAYFDHVYPTIDSGQRGNGKMLDYFGRSSPQYDSHDGHDYVFPDKPIGTYIYAAADGMAYASTHRGNGVWIQHANGYVTVYWHLDKFAKKFRGKVDTGEGTPVRAGDLIGSSGSSGFVRGTPHLHFEVRHNGKQVDPYGWYGNGTDPCALYAGCESSRWLWAPELSGEFDFTPP